MIPVWWLLGRGWWDQALLESILARDIWRPACARRFSHRIGFEESSRSPAGGIMVMPGQHAVQFTDGINEAIDRLDWCIVVIGGDEEALFPAEAIKHPRMLLYVQTPRPNRHSFAERFLPVGPTPQALRLLRRASINAMERPLDWFFSGQVPEDHPARVELVQTLRFMEEMGSKGDLHPTSRFGEQYAVDTEDPDAAHLAYLARLASAKLAPAPSGPVTPDSFRCWEALEAGCLPIVNSHAPYAETAGYWPFLLGEEPVFPVVEDWSDFPIVANDLLAAWPANANAAFAWWQTYKRSLSYIVEDDIAWLADEHSAAERPADRITVLIPTSPIPSHPDTGIIEATVASIRAQHHLIDAEIIVMFDGVRPEEEHRRADYEEYQRRLLWMINHVWRNVVPLRFSEHSHQATMTRDALRSVRTPLVLFVEHDTPVIGHIDWFGLCRVIGTGEAQIIRLHHSTEIYEGHRHMMIDDQPSTLHGVPLLRTAQWSQRPHLASTETYRRILQDHFAPDEHWMIEDRMHGVVGEAWRNEGDAGWDRYRLFIYAPPGNMQRSTHLDGRAGAPKWVDR